MTNPRKQPSIVYNPTSMNCPLKRCDYAGKSTICYLEAQYRDCEIYNDESYIDEFLDTYRKSEGLDMEVQDD